MTIASGTCGDSATWRLDDDYTLYIEGTGDMSDFGQTDRPWYSYEGFISKVIISEGITRIGRWSFGDLYCLLSVKVPTTVTSIGSNAFRYVPIVELDLPGVQTIERYAFENCYIRKINMQNVREIATYAFARSYLVSVAFPESLSTIGTYAFSGCPILESVIFPESLTSIGESAFYNCHNLKYIRFKGDKPSIHQYSFYQLSNVICLTDKGWGNSSTVGSSNWIYNFDTKIGDNLTWSIDENLVLTITGTGPTYDYDTTTYQKVPFRNVKLRDIVWDDRVTRIGSYFLYNAESTTLSRMQSMKFPEHLRSIGRDAFHSHRFRSLILPASLGSIENSGLYRQLDSSCKHFVIVYRGKKPSIDTTGIPWASNNGCMVHEFSSVAMENTSYLDSGYGSGQVNSSYPIMMKVGNGWEVIDSTYMVDKT